MACFPRACAGIGLRGPHVRELLQRRPPLDLLEVHCENYFSDGGIPAWVLEQVRQHYPLSLHGVGLSLGSSDPLCTSHLRQLRQLVERCQPSLVSEHLCWNSIGGQHFSDLLPLPRSTAVIAHLVSRIGQVQDALGRSLLLENLASYLQFVDDCWPEPAFIAEIARRSGCRLLIDLNNVHVCGANHGFDPAQWIAAIPRELVGQIHLAGNSVRDWQYGHLLLDTHAAAVSSEVWRLYELALAHYGPRPTVIEWDAELPALDELVAEADRARSMARGSGGLLPDHPVIALTDRSCPAPTLPLHQLQQQFAAAMCDPDAVVPLALRAPPDEQSGRLAIYRNNHRQNLAAALADIYPVLRRLLGIPCFDSLARRYVSAQASCSGNLLDYGGLLAAKIAGCPEFAEWPWLADMAAFEWSLHRLFHAPAASEVLTPAALAPLDGEELARLRLRLIPATVLFASQWPILRIWQSNQVELSSVGQVSLDEGGVKCLLHRPGLQIQTRTVEHAEFEFLQALQRHLPFGDAAAAALAIDPRFDLPATLSWLLGQRLLHLG